MERSLDFDSLETIERPVKYKGGLYILREASESAAKQYRNALTRSAKLGPNGKPSEITNMADVDSLLVSLCLYSTVSGKADKLVPITTILTWERRVVQALYETCTEISGLQEKTTKEALEKRIRDTQKQIEEMTEEDPLKNSQSSTQMT